MTQPEIMDWLKTIPASSSVGVDDGGLSLVEIDADGEQTGAYCEIGGIPEDEE